MGEGELYVIPVDGSIAERRIASLPGDQLPTAWPSEELLVFEEEPLGRGIPDLYMIAPTGDSDPVPYLRADFGETALAVSPNGSLAAYVSNEASGQDVYVRGFPDPLGQRRVSTGGGRFPRWSPNGESLYYWVPDEGRLGPHTLYEVSVQTGPNLSFGAPEALFSGAFLPGSWDVHPDGERFLVTELVDAGEVTEGGETARTRRIVVLNWFERLREMMGGGS